MVVRPARPFSKRVEDNRHARRFSMKIDRIIQKNLLIISFIGMISISLLVFIYSVEYFSLKIYSPITSFDRKRFFIQTDCDESYRLEFIAHVDSEHSLRAYPHFFDENGKNADIGRHCKSISVTSEGMPISLIRTFDGEPLGKKFDNQVFLRKEGYDESSFSVHENMNSSFFIELDPMIEARSFAENHCQIGLSYQQNIESREPRSKIILSLPIRHKIDFITLMSGDMFHQYGKISQNSSINNNSYNIFPANDKYPSPSKGDYIDAEFDYYSDFLRRLENLLLTCLASLLTVFFGIFIDSAIIHRTLTKHDTNSE